MNTQLWTVSDAKAHLSEILRRARSEGPQQIGTRNPCVLISEKEWNALSKDKSRVGKWLVENLAGAGALDLPSRADPDRPVPFEDL